MNDAPGLESHTNKRAEVTVLALHGYGQTPDDLSRPLGRLFKARPGETPLRVIAVPAPIPIGALASGETTTPAHATSGGRAWWRRPTLAVRDFFSYREFDESRAAVIAATDGIDIGVVAGFSQGAVMATLLLQTGALPTCRCAVLFGASGVQDPDMALLPLACVPALVVHGVKDTLCDVDDARRLGAAYVEAQYASHKWGHVIPTDAASRNVVLEFVARSAAAGRVASSC
jgi:predicted esterase